MKKYYINAGALSYKATLTIGMGKYFQLTGDTIVIGCPVLGFSPFSRSDMYPFDNPDFAANSRCDKSCLFLYSFM